MLRKAFFSFASSMILMAPDYVRSEDSKSPAIVLMISFHTLHDVYFLHWCEDGV